MQRWLARLSFSFFIIAAVFTWEGYKLLQNQSQGSLLYFIGAGALGALGAAGVRARHQDN